MSQAHIDHLKEEFLECCAMFFDEGQSIGNDSPFSLDGDPITAGELLERIQLGH